MKYLVDSHSHTIVSGHAYSTRMEMIQAAKTKGLEALALTEHAPKMPGTCHEFYFQNYPGVPRTVDGLHIFMGAELNILDELGTVDLPDFVLQSLDLAIASIHGPCYSTNSEIIEKGSRDLNTQAYLNVMKNPYIHIIGHPDDGRFPLDYERLVRGAKETHTLLELNNSSQRPEGFRVNTEENAKVMLELCKKEGVYITTGSDAHIDIDVGGFSCIEKLVQEADFPEELIATTSYEKFSRLIRQKG